jgi:hypothetical protein
MVNARIGKQKRSSPNSTNIIPKKNDQRLDKKKPRKIKKHPSTNDPKSHLLGTFGKFIEFIVCF